MTFLEDEWARAVCQKKKKSAAAWRNDLTWNLKLPLLVIPQNVNYSWLVNNSIILVSLSESLWSLGHLLCRGRVFWCILLYFSSLMPKSHSTFPQRWYDKCVPQARVHVCMSISFLCCITYLAHKLLKSKTFLPYQRKHSAFLTSLIIVFPNQGELWIQRIGVSESMSP